MGTDNSRVTFDPAKHYTSVRQQQGRVSLDADWNEQVDITRHRVETETADVIGPCGAPRDNAGFQIQGPGLWAPATFFAIGAEIIDSNGGVEIAISAGTSGATAPAWPTAAGGTVADGSGLVWQLIQRDMTLSPGRIYVDGLMCDLTAAVIPIENFSGDGTGAPGTQVRVSPTLLAELELEPGQFVQISAQGGQAPPQLVQITSVNPAAGSLTFGSKVSAFGSPSFNPQLQQVVTYLTQPDYPSPPPLPTGGTSIVYLDVWERNITALEDPDLLEIALGGPDTTTRTKTVWQVKLIDVSSVPGMVTCSTAPTAMAPWERVTQRSAIQLTNGVVSSPSSGPCSITSNTGFTGMENQLYRVEIHASGMYGWKASAPYLAGAQIVDSNGNLQIAVAAAGISGTAAPSWPTSIGAITNDGDITWQLLTLGLLPLWKASTAYAVGSQVVDPNGNVETAVAAGTSGNAAPAWPTGPGASIVDGTSGLMWQFAAPTFKWSRENASVATAVTGIAAVTNTGGKSASQLTVASLGRDQVLGFAPGNWVEITDDWQELNRQPGELHLIDSSDVAASTITLNSPVSSSSFPTVAGQTNPSRHTRLTRWDQSGKIYLSDGVTVWTDLGAAGSTGDIPVPPVGTTVLLENGITISFSSNPSNGPLYSGDYWVFAARTADGSVEPLVQSYPRGVQHHFCRLGIINFGANPWTFQDCRQLFPPLSDPGVHVTGVFLGSGVPLSNDSTIGVQTDLARGINVVCDTPLDPATISQPASTAAIGAQATCYVTVGAPALSGGSVIGFNPLILSAAVTLDSSQTIIGWTPSSASIAGLANQIAAANFPPVLARLILKGNFIWAQGNPHAYLQGNVLGAPYTDSSNIQHTGLQLPSGTGRRGGDFDLWFWLVSAPPVSLSALSLDFGNQLVGTSATQTITLTNNNASSVGIAVAGADPGDFSQSNSCSAVAVGQSCTISVTFKPTQTGARSAQIAISAGSSQVAVVELTGNGIEPGLSVSPTSLAFGVVTVGGISAPQTVTLTNSGAAPLTLTSIAISANFNQTSTCGLSPGTLSPGASCVITVHFAPAASGTIAGTLTIASNVPGPPTVVQLSGTGLIKTKDTKDSKDNADSKGAKDTRDRKSVIIDKVADKVPDVVIKQTLTSEQSKPAGQEAEGTREAFIKPEERPAVGQKALEKPSEGKQ